MFNVWQNLQFENSVVNNNGIAACLISLISILLLAIILLISL